jgi:hypothetical protein
MIVSGGDLLVIGSRTAGQMVEDDFINSEFELMGIGLVLSRLSWWCPTIGGRRVSRCSGGIQRESRRT